MTRGNPLRRDPFSSLTSVVVVVTECSSLGNPGSVKYLPGDLVRLTGFVKWGESCDKREKKEKSLFQREATGWTSRYLGSI